MFSRMHNEPSLRQCPEISAVLHDIVCISYCGLKRPVRQLSSRQRHGSALNFTQSHLTAAVRAETGFNVALCCSSRARKAACLHDCHFYLRRLGQLSSHSQLRRWTFRSSLVYDVRHTFHRRIGSDDSFDFHLLRLIHGRSCTRSTAVSMFCVLRATRGWDLQCSRHIPVMRLSYLRRHVMFDLV